MLRGVYTQNKGNTVVEATLILPLFIMGMISVYHMGRVKMAEQVLYEAAVETAEYLAEEAYLEIYNPLTPYIKFRDYIDDNELVNMYITNGANGVTIYGYTKPDADNKLTITYQYQTRMRVFLFPLLSSNHTITIEQRAYVGDASRDVSEIDEGNRYVFVTDNKDVYHLSRNCTYLLLSVQATSYTNAQLLGFTACEFCGDDVIQGNVYVTDEGRRFHSNLGCSGLKRTVYRVKKSSVGGLPICTRCASKEW